MESHALGAQPGSGNMDTFCCPITGEIMKDPVIGKDGYTYEKEAILEWLKNHRESPMTREAMAESDLVPNRILREQIEAMGSNP